MHMDTQTTRSLLLSPGAFLALFSLALFIWRLFLPEPTFLALFAPILTMALGFALIRQKYVAMKRQQHPKDQDPPTGA